MPRKHPIIAVTGLSGTGTPAVRLAFETIFRREVKVRAVFIESAGSFMSRANTLVVPGGMMGHAMEVIL